MDEKYKGTIKTIRIAAVIIGLGLLGFGIARFFIAGDIFSLGEFGLLGLFCIVALLAITAKMDHDYEREGLSPGEEKEEFEHDIGY